MAQRKLTIHLPESSEALHTLAQILLEHGFITEEEAKSIEQGHIKKSIQKKSRWALASERLKSEGFLKGRGDEVKKLIRDFRENFDL